MYSFGWDRKKAAENLKKHGVSFDEATTVFLDPLAGTAFDEAHSDDEERWFTIGISARRRLLIVWHAVRGERIHMIGARVPTPAERRMYEENP